MALILRCVIIVLVVWMDCFVSSYDFINFPTLEEFATSPVTYENRIVGGHEANIEDHPYQVSFIYNDPASFCAGFIVSENYIVTAAHCARDLDLSTVVLRAGSSFYENGTIIPIAEVTPHPEYNNITFDKDVAVMKTVKPIEFTKTIQSIPLPPEGRPMSGRTIIKFSGWGWGEHGPFADRLMEVEIPVVYHRACYLSYIGVLTKNEFCAGNFFGEQGFCLGDSGGAATQAGYAVGIASYVNGCGDPLRPSVFTDIASPPIRRFIKNHTGI